jgi:hypothetical protein
MRSPVGPIDSLAALAETQHQLHDRLLPLTPAVPDQLAAAWQASAEPAQALAAPVKEATGLPDQYLILITCRIESNQTELLGRLHGELVECQALLS